jgi:hypothetical protein
MALRNAHRALERHEARTAPTGRRDPASAGATIVAEVPRRTWLKARGAVRGAVANEPPDSNKAREVRRREQIARRACDYSARSIGALFRPQLARARETRHPAHANDRQCDRGSARAPPRTVSEANPFPSVLNPYAQVLADDRRGLSNRPRRGPERWRQAVIGSPRSCRGHATKAGREPILRAPGSRLAKSDVRYTLRGSAVRNLTLIHGVSRGSARGEFCGGWLYQFEGRVESSTKT